MFETVVKSARLISLPEIYLQLKELIEEPDYTMAEVAILVGRDPGMTTRFLRVVNNPMNNMVCQIETIGHAVSLLGIRQVHDIVLSASVAEAFAGIKNSVMSMKTFWQRSFYCATLSKILANECGLIDGDRLFVMGLLHDIGHLFMYLSIPEKAQEIILKAKKHNHPLHQLEREMLGFDYAKVGGTVMEQWGLPKRIQAVTHAHPEPGKAEEYAKETALVHLSMLLVRSELEAGIFDEGSFAVDPAAWSITNLTAERCLDLKLSAAEEYIEVANSVFM